MDILLNDLRYAARMMWKSKVVTVIAVLSLAAGIGANTAIFSVANAILLRPRAVSKPEQLVEIYTGDRQNPYQTSSYPTYLEFRERNEVFTGLAAYGLGYQFKLGGATDIEQVWGEVVSGNYFDVLGVRALRGRTFLSEEDLVPGRNPVVVIGHGLWQRRFNGDPGVIGTSVTINNQPVTVVGVAPPQYTGMFRGWASEVWVPAMVAPLLDPRRGQGMLTRDSKWVTLVGRLKPGVTIDDARARIELLSQQLRIAHPDEWRSGEGDSARDLFVSVLPEKETRVHPAMRGVAFAVVGLLIVVVDLVLLIAGMNLAGMLFARAVVRRHEIAVRVALGAGRGRIIRQLLTESVLLSLIAGVIGAVLAFWGLRLVMTFMPALPEGIRVAIDVPIDWGVLLYTLAVSMAVGLLLGLAPALHSANAAVSTVLRDEASAVTPRYRTSRVRTGLLIAQVACSVLLLIGAGLALRSLENVRPTRLGFQSENMVVAPIVLDESDYTRADAQRFYERLSESLAPLPGVEAVSLVEGMPGGFMSRQRRGTEVDGYAARPGEDMEIDASIAGPHYFTNMRVPFVQGRDFDARDRDGAPCVAIVNEVFVRRYLAGTASPLGRRLTKYEDDVTGKQWCEIVGVIRDDAWQSLQKDVRPFFALALQQSHRRRMTLLVSTAGDPRSLTSAVRQAIRSLDSTIPVTDVQTLDEHFDVTLYPFRLAGLVVGACGLLALLLAAIGIYGVVSYSVAQRTREVGIRMALGALRSDILTLIVTQGMVLVAYGLGVGLVLGIVVTLALASLPLDTELLFGVSATDPVTFGGVTIFLALVALLACFVPALRAARVDPMVTLRDA